jgi:hypothetical protein
MSELKVKLTELETLLKQFEYPILNCLQPGKDKDDPIIGELFTNLKFPIRHDLEDMYRWKNGVVGLYEKPTGELELFPNGIMMPLEYAVSAYALEAKVHKLLDKEYFPLFTSGGGDYILINMDKTKPAYGQLFLYSLPILLTERPMAIYDSVTTLFETLLEIYRLRGYYFSPNKKALEVNYEVENEISIRMNPKSEFWKQG